MAGTNSDIVLDLAWSELDSKKQGFIQGKQFPSLVDHIDSILQKNAPTGRYNSTLLVPELGKEAFDVFLGSRAYYKIYKRDFYDTFQQVVGKPFGTIIESVFPQGEIPQLLQHKRDTLLNNNSEHTSPKKLKRLETQIDSLNQELWSKNQLIVDKDATILDLTKQLNDYKHKYNYIQREFDFYKTQGEKLTPPSQHDDAITQNEFIISELKRKLEEQMNIIMDLRQELQLSNPIYELNLHKKIISPQLNWSPIILLSLTLLIIAYTAVRLSNTFHTPQDVESHIVGKLAWWEKNSFLSRVGWFLKELVYTDSNNHAYSKSSNPLQSSAEAYDKVFGITH